MKLLNAQKNMKNYSFILFIYFIFPIFLSAFSFLFIEAKIENFFRIV